MSATLHCRVSSLESLRGAWQRVRASGLASKAEMTRQAIRSFEESCESRIGEISEELREGCFDFGPSRGVLIPRPGKNPRPLLVAAIPARIVQRAILDVLQDVDAVLNLILSPYSFGGRPGGSVKRAVYSACEVIHDGKAYFLRSDIGEFFTRVPRADVLITLSDLLPDSSLEALLEKATNLEIENLSELGKYRALMPNEFEGIAQGCCLSPLFGNVLLHDFDREMNTDGITTLRYIDDFLILGKDRRSVQKAFATARAILKQLNLGAYRPADGTGKAAQGPVRKGFEFLGCWITPRTIEPSRKARRAFVARVETELRHARHNLKHAAAGDYKCSLVASLHKVSRMVEAWTKQYSFCNPTEAFWSVDVRVDRLVQTYLNSFFATYRKRKTSLEARRRLLGIWLATDAERSPILPISTRETAETCPPLFGPPEPIEFKPIP